MNNLSRAEVEALAAVQNALRMVWRAARFCAVADMDGDEIMQPLDEARRLLVQVAKVIQG